MNTADLRNRLLGLIDEARESLPDQDIADVIVDVLDDALDVLVGEEG